MDPRVRRRDYTMALFGASLCLVLFSYFLFVFHTYCEDRPAMLVLAAAAAAAVGHLASHWPIVSWRRGVAAVAILFCLIVAGFNAWYFVWATTMCNQQ